MSSSLNPVMNGMVHKRILEWQARHPIATWLFWALVWAAVLIALWPNPAHGLHVQGWVRAGL